MVKNGDLKLTFYEVKLKIYSLKDKNYLEGIRLNLELQKELPYLDLNSTRNSADEIVEIRSQDC